MPTQALHPHVRLINTILGLPTRPLRTTATDLGSPGAANYFANSREKYLAHSQQERQASSVTLLHLPLHGAGAALRGFGDKGLGSITGQQQDSRSQAAFRAAFDQYLHRIFVFRLGFFFFKKTTHTHMWEKWTRYFLGLITIINLKINFESHLASSPPGHRH